MTSPLRPLRGLAIAPWFVLALTGCLGSPSDLEGEGELREPIERPADVGAADSACGTFPADHFRYLDDTRCARRMPSDRSRTWSCPNTATSARTRPAGGTRDVTYTRDGRPSSVDLETLRPFVPSDVAMSVALIRRVDGEAHVRWLGTARHAEPVQPWSSTKWLAIVNAAARLRTLSGYRIGLDASVSGIPLGDLATVVHQYDERRYSSNGLARWFLDIGGRSRANGLMRTWLGRPARETYGGNYGAPSAVLPYSFSSGAATLDVTPDLGTGPANQLSTDALAVAKDNALRLGALIAFVQSDGFDALGTDAVKLDLITANPPYIPEANHATLPVDVRAFEPKVALTSGADGLDLTRRIVAAAPHALVTGGVLAVEIDAPSSHAVRELFEAAGFEAITVTRDYAGLDRIVSGRRK
jgi:hypothetical protein